jgi:hypothetical protein
MAQHQLMTVWWDDVDKGWTVSARPDGSVEDWSTWDGDESELDALLSLGRDVMTGG